MFTLHIEHRVLNYDAWKRAFDSDPAGRQRAGVLRYRISHPMEDRNFISIDLDFKTAREAEALLASLKVIWGPIEGKVITGPQGRVFQVVESKEY